MPGRPIIWIIVGQGPIALAVGADGGCLDIFTLLYLFSSLSPCLWETVLYRLKYCLKGPLNPKQPTNQYFCSRHLASCTNHIFFKHVRLSVSVISYAVQTTRPEKCDIFAQRYQSQSITTKFPKTLLIFLNLQKQCQNISLSEYNA